jgi:hypothetical protein
MQRCYPDCTLQCRPCRKEHRVFNLNYKLYEFHSQIIPNKLLDFLINPPEKEIKNSGTVINIFNYPFFVIDESLKFTESTYSNLLKLFKF